MYAVNTNLTLGLKEIKCTYLLAIASSLSVCVRDGFCALSVLIIKTLLWNYIPAFNVGK